MSTDLAPRSNGAVLDQVIAGGDLASLTAEQRLSFYRQVCESLSLNPLTQPFAYIKLNGKLTLYATRNTTDQLRQLHGITLQIVSQEKIEDLYVVTCRATKSDGRSDEDTGVVSLAGLRGEALANGIMKAITKSKRRVTLSICGLGFLDETEVETIPGARRVDVRDTGEIVSVAAPVERHTLAEWRALYEQERERVGGRLAAAGELVPEELVDDCNLPPDAPPGAVKDACLRLRAWNAAQAPAAQ